MEIEDEEKTACDFPDCKCQFDMGSNGLCAMGLPRVWEVNKDEGDPKPLDFDED